MGRSRTARSQLRQIVSDNRVHSRMQVLMKGGSVADWTWLLRIDELRSKLNVYEDPSVYGLDESWPWPVVWTLARFNKSFIACPRKLPRPDWARGCLKEFARRMHWRWHFPNSDQPPPSVRIKATSDSRPSVVAPEISSWLTTLDVSMNSKVAAALHSATFSRIQLSNELGITQLGWNLLRSLNVVAI